jgi:hypothetical protein
LQREVGRIKLPIESFSSKQIDARSSAKAR